MHRAIMTALALLLTSSPCWADIPRKQPPVDVVKLTKTNVPITVTYAAAKENGAERPRLQIPRKLMVAAGITDGEPIAAAPARGSLLAGIALAATFVTGGLWLVRRGGKGAHGLLALFVLSGALGVSAFLPEIFGNISPPFFPPKVAVADPLPLKIDGRAAKLSVDIVIVADGDRIQLVLPASLAPAAMAKPVEAPKAEAK